MQRVQSLQLGYVFTWSAQNITHCTTSTIHSQALILLLQVYRARSLLSSELFTLRRISGEAKVAVPLNGNTLIALKLRQRLLWFANVVHDHIASTTSTLHATMLTQMEAAEGIDSMSAHWKQYKRRLSVSLLLSEKLGPMREAVDKILSTCESFVQHWRRSLEQEEPSAIKNDANVGETYPAIMMREVNTSLSFIVAGLRGIGRAGGDVALEALAESLDWITAFPT